MINKTPTIVKKAEKRNTRYGDTIVEAVIAIAIYSVVAVLALGAMNSGLKSAQKNLESTMSRAATDSQVDSLRYIYENYLIALNTANSDSAYYKKIWEELIAGNGAALGHMNEVTDEAQIAALVHSLDGLNSCEDLISADQLANPTANIAMKLKSTNIQYSLRRARPEKQQYLSLMQLMK